MAVASRGVSRRRGTSPVPQMCPRCVRVFSKQTTSSTDLQALSESPLTDSNRRPPPYHRSPRREARASAGHGDHENPAKRRDQPTTSDRVWTHVDGLVFPRCSLLQRTRSPRSVRASTVKRLAPEPCPATNTEPRLHSLVLLPIFQRCPDEQAADDDGGQGDDKQNKNNRGRGIHGRRGPQAYAHRAEWTHAPKEGGNATDCGYESGGFGVRRQPPLLGLMLA